MLKFVLNFRTRGVRVFFCVAGLPDQMFTWLVHDTMMPVSLNFVCDLCIDQISRLHSDCFLGIKNM